MTGNFGSTFEIGADRMMLSMYEKDLVLYMIAHINKEKGRKKDHYRIIGLMPDGSIGVDMSHSTKLKDLEFMQYKLDDMADDNEWKWHGKRKTVYEIEDPFQKVLDTQDYFTMELG